MLYQRPATLNSPKFTTLYTQKSQPILDTYPVVASDNKSTNRNIRIKNIQARATLTSQQNDFFAPDQYLDKNGRQLHLPHGSELRYQLDNEEYDGQLNQQGLVFDIDGHNLSPIINTCITDKGDKNGKTGKYRELNVELSNQYSNQREYLHERQAHFKANRNNKNNRMNSPQWKQLINPDVQYFYNQIVGTKKSAKQKKLQTIHKSKDQSQCSVQQITNKNNNLDNPRKSQCISRQNQATKSVKNKSAVLNQLQVQEGANQGNVVVSMYSSKNNDKMVTGITYVSHNEISDIKKTYEDRISVLEHQNTNLKDQLFYLRAAILAQYQAKQQAKSSSQKSFK